MATPGAAKHRDLEQRFLDLEAALAQVRGVIARRPKFEVSSGDLTIDGGDVLMLDTDGSVLFRLGAQTEGDRGITIYRQDATPALRISRPDPILPQRVELFDGDGNAIVQESFEGNGLNKPRLSLPLVPIAAPAAYGVRGPEVSTTSGTFVGVFRLQTRQQNPLWQPGFYVRTSDTTTAAEVQAVNVATGTPLNEFFGSPYLGTVAAGTTAHRELIPSIRLPGVMEDRITVEVQVRRTAGAGTVFVAAPESVGG